MPQRWEAAAWAKDARRVLTPVLLIYAAAGSLPSQGQAWRGALTRALAWRTSRSWCRAPTTCSPLVQHSSRWPRSDGDHRVHHQIPREDPKRLATRRFTIEGLRDVAGAHQIEGKRARCFATYSSWGGPGGPDRVCVSRPGSQCGSHGRASVSRQSRSLLAAVAEQHWYPQIPYYVVSVLGVVVGALGILSPAARPSSLRPDQMRRRAMNGAARTSCR